MESAWNLYVNEPQAIAIAYVYLQKQANEEKHTEMDIYNIIFTPEAFEKILDLCVKYSDGKTENVECPGANCDCYKDWYWDSYYEEWDYDYIEFCPHCHTLHRLGLAFFTKEEVMNALGFTNKEQEWTALTEEYFKTLTS